MNRFDHLIVGAGLSGCVMAERLASIGRRVLLIDKRPHLGGNCYDFYDAAGVLIHKYGPHYFRAKSDAVVDYLSAFTDWIPHQYKVRIRIRDTLYSFPINKKTFEQFFKRSFRSPAEAAAFVDTIKDASIVAPSNAEEQVVSMIGRRLYESFFKGYTEKQWGVPATALDASVTARIPIRYDDNDNYVVEPFQAMPRDGYTALFKRMLNRETIETRLATPYSSELARCAREIIWTGRIDEYFGFQFGRLPYRSLNFVFLSFFGKNYVQEEGQINFPAADVPYTRSLEIKHVTHQVCPNTTLSLEFPASEGDPYYPMPTLDGTRLYDRYLQASRDLAHVHFLGRLARFKYLNMDQCVEDALAMFEALRDR